MGCKGVASPAKAEPSRTRIYVTLVSHNETRGNPPCDRILAPRVPSCDAYLANRQAVVEFANRVVAAGAAYDFQSDWLFLQHVEACDVGDVLDSTNGKNLIRWLAERAPGQISVDPHSHEAMGFNLADVAKMLLDLGAPDTGVVGGFLANPPEEANWERFRAPLKANRSDYVFEARTLWGGGSVFHVEDLRASGIWRPKSIEEFFEDDPAQSLSNIGGYEAAILEAEHVLELLARLRNGELEENRLYTVTIMSRQCDFDLEGPLDDLDTVLADLAPEIATGDLVWATLPEVIRVWEEEYDSQPVTLPVQ